MARVRKNYDVYSCPECSFRISGASEHVYPAVDKVGPHPHTGEENNSEHAAQLQERLSDAEARLQEYTERQSKVKTEPDPDDSGSSTPEDGSEEPTKADTPTSSSSPRTASKGRTSRKTPRMDTGDPTS